MSPQSPPCLCGGPARRDRVAPWSFSRPLPPSPLSCLLPTPGPRLKEPARRCTPVSSEAGLDSTWAPGESVGYPREAVGRRRGGNQCLQVSYVYMTQCAKVTYCGCVIFLVIGTIPPSPVFTSTDSFPKSPLSKAWQSESSSLWWSFLTSS
uniref:Uncharacterized protein n=1 Tax=Panthera leo TaxID=9689 RepID=A0A8C8Y013_PANLE